MGQVKLRKSPAFTPLQKRIFELVVEDRLIATEFYLTGGTALSAFYLAHRESEDLDFFSDTDFDNAHIALIMERVSRIIEAPYRFTQNERARIGEFSRGGTFMIKVDFVYHPYMRIAKGGHYRGIPIDSLLDIATNKLLTINQRTDVKDFVDLYFLLKEFTLWDLLYGVEVKYRRELDLILLGMDFMKVEQFDVLPNMLVPLTIKQLRNFFKAKAIELAKRTVE